LNSLSTHHDAEVVDFLKRILVVSLCASVVAGCAILDSRSPEQVVQERAQQRWDELVKGDLRKAYGYLSPGSRSVMSPEAYEGSIKRGFWKSAKVDKVECATPQSCDAAVTIEYEFQGRRTKTPLRETWIKEGSEWWYLQK